MDIKVYTHTEKKDLVKNMEKLTSKNQYKQIYKIIKLSGVKITVNNNGIFFNMNELSNETLKMIDDYINSVINKSNSNIDIKYYNNVIMNTTTQSEGDISKIYDYNNDSANNE
jgi:hypothetical protein